MTRLLAARVRKMKLAPMLGVLLVGGIGVGGMGGMGGCAARARLEASDLDALAGGGRPWVGTLTYLDYTSHEPTTIDSSLIVRRIGDDPPAWAFGYGYSKEPQADSTTVLTLTRDGGRLGDETVVAREAIAGGGIRYTTESRGEDDHRPASFRFEHTLTEHEFTRRKLVRFDGDPTPIERHVYRWTR